MSAQYLIIDTESHNTGFDIIRRRGQRFISFDLIRDERGWELLIPLRSIPHGRMPPEFDQFRRQNGVYIIVDAYRDVPVYVGESHANRLIHTATRHIQSWDLGPTWDREDVLFAFILSSDPDSAYTLQNLIIAEFILNGVALEHNTDDRPEDIYYGPDDTPF